MVNLSSMSYEDKVLLYQKLREKQVLEANERLIPFIKSVNPDFVEGKHHEAIAERLEAVERGELNRLMIFMPPRSSKSFMVSEHLPAWYLGKNPKKQVLAASYGADLASAWGSKVRDLVGSKEYRAIFPDVTLHPEVRASLRWMIKYKDRPAGVYNGSGTTGGIAGKGASLGIIDDPISEQQAFSKAERNRVINWYPGGMRSRLMPGGSVILTMTRWHEDDLAGHLLHQALNNPEADQWEVLKIPAILDKTSAQVLGLPDGGSYWPPHPSPPEGVELIGWDLKELEKTRENMPPEQWAALYMQTPIIEGGNILKSSYWMDWGPTDPPECDYIFLSVDTAFGTRKDNAYSAITTWGVFRDNDGIPNTIMLGGVKDHWTFDELRQNVISTYEYHNADMILIEEQASGRSLIQEFQRTGLPVMPFNPDKDKEARAHACVPIFHANRVWVPWSKDWAQKVIQECSTFPRGKHKDFVDTVTQAILYMRDSLFLTITGEPWITYGQQEEDDSFPTRGNVSYY
jgi:predicted phage terminase large subunit-like protein